MNIRGGRLPEPGARRRFLKIPLNALPGAVVESGDGGLRPGGKE
jgi:hypothetical protein